MRLERTLAFAFTFAFTFTFIGSRIPRVAVTWHPSFLHWRCATYWPPWQTSSCLPSVAHATMPPTPQGSATFETVSSQEKSPSRHPRPPRQKRSTCIRPSLQTRRVFRSTLHAKLLGRWQGSSFRAKWPSQVTSSPWMEQAFGPRQRSTTRNFPSSQTRCVALSTLQAWFSLSVVRHASPSSATESSHVTLFPSFLHLLGPRQRDETRTPAWQVRTFPSSSQTARRTSSHRAPAFDLHPLAVERPASASVTAKKRSMAGVGLTFGGGRQGAIRVELSVEVKPNGHLPAQAACLAGRQGRRYPEEMLVCGASLRRARARPALVASWALLVACASSSSDPPPRGEACPDVGAECTLDAACCTGHCVMEGDKAYCQVSPRSPSACVVAGLPCTEDAHCCGGHCLEMRCALPPSCRGIGDLCALDASCCSGSCFEGTCRAPSAPPAPAACTAPGGPCRDDVECCLRACVGGACGGGGVPGVPACGAAGEPCHVGSDCCSEQCEATAATSVCR